MTTVTVSPKFQIIIPKNIRQELKIAAGAKVDFIIYDGIINIIPIRSIKSMRRSLKGIDTTIIRDKDRVI